MTFERGQAPIVFLPLRQFETCTGYKRDQVLRNIKRGMWRQNQMWVGRLPDDISIHLPTFHAWVEGRPLCEIPEFMPRRRKPAPGEQDRRRRGAVKRQTPPWADRRAIDAIYIEARRLTRETGIRHEVDHAIPLLGRNVSGLHVETNLQILTAGDNAKKANRFE